jgi:integrase
LSYFAKKPGGGRTSFALIKKEKGVKGTSQLTVKNDEVTSINDLLKKSVITLERANQLVFDLVSRLNREKARAKYPESHAFHPVNLKIINGYLTDEYSDRDLVDSGTIKHELKRAILAIGQLSLQTASKEELQAFLNSKYKADPNRQRRIVGKLNTLLKYLNRGFRLRKQREVFVEVVSIDRSEMTFASKQVPPELSLLIRVAFWTGARFGELMALTESSFRDDHLFIQYQIDRQLQRRETKTRKERKALIIPDGVEDVKTWCAISHDNKNSLRSLNAGYHLSKVLGRKVRFHDLRHSYARILAEQDLGLTEISEYIGDSLVVCEKHYKGWVRSEFAISSRFKQLKLRS